MNPLFAAGTALAISLAIIPLMYRFAPRLRLLDQPNVRKVHAQPIPRVGGWGISVGSLAAVYLWQPAAPITTGFFLGGLILLFAGAADDVMELRGLTKLLLQFIAVVPVVFYVFLKLQSPHIVIAGYELTAPIAIAGSALAIITCINATNTSDGLDGLAAGATLLSLFGILYLAFTGQSREVLLMAAAAIGGLIGFLRYNTHPAIIFMGDLGSQFLGFTTSFLLLALYTLKPESVSLAGIALLLGLPVVDIAFVAVRRLLRRQSMFVADKTHIHHRFLNLGFSHAQSVVVFYLIQASFVFFGVAMRNSEVWKVWLVYFSHIAAVYGFLHLAEGNEASTHFANHRNRQVLERSTEPSQLLLWVPRVALELLLPLSLVICALIASEVTFDFGLLGAALLSFLALRMAVPALQKASFTRVPVFLVTTAIIYVYTSGRPFVSTLSWIVEVSVLSTMAVMVWVAVRFSPKRRKEEFHATAMDYLMVVFALLSVAALRTIPSAFNASFLIYLPVLLYCCELLLVERRQRRSWLPAAATVAAVILAIRGLLLGG